MFNGLWKFARTEAGEEERGSRVHPRLFIGDVRERWRDSRVYYSALFAREGTGSGERYRKAAKWSLFGFVLAVVLFIVAGLLSVT